MLRFYLVIAVSICLILTCKNAFSQNTSFVVDTLYQGNKKSSINFLLMGDGFTADQQGKFKKRAEDIIKAILDAKPYKNYKDYFNFYAIEVISKDSGVIHPQLGDNLKNDNAVDKAKCLTIPKNLVDIYFQSSLDFGGYHRIMFPNYQLVDKLENEYVKKEAIPNCEYRLVLLNVNSEGASGDRTTRILAIPNGSKLLSAVHEMGHSFAGLADEYWFYSNTPAQNRQLFSPLR